MIEQGKTFEALDKFYADHVVVVEADGSTREGKETQRKALEEWEQNVQTMHGGGVGAITSNEEAGTTCVESWVDLTDQKGNRYKMEEVAVQKWEGDKIVHERFYYHIPG